MNKAILISIKPKYVAKILNGEKTIEIRKTMPKCDLPIDVYIYCTEDIKNYLYWDWFDAPYVEQEWFTSTNAHIWAEDRKNINGWFNGKVVAKFTLNKVELIRPIALGSFLTTSTLEHREIIDKSCLTENEIRRYLKNMYGYAWHISNLVIFDKPKEISEFENICRPKIREKCHTCKYWSYRHCPNGKCENNLTKAPQSWCYVEV